MKKNTGSFPFPKLGKPLNRLDVFTFHSDRAGKRVRIEALSDPVTLCKTKELVYGYPFRLRNSFRG